MVLDNLRPLFKVFIEAFDVPSKLTVVDAAQVRRLVVSPMYAN